MNAQETVELLRALKEVGATHFKSHEIEVRLSGGMSQFVKPAQPLAPPSKEEPAFNAENTKKAQDLIDLLKMKDDQLVNQIFPDGAL